ncbi:MAG: TIGR03936 family radical SAM-associated protein [Lachnospiraceae bacterium]|nr:TIGR03936 family radical SAM-associated protein [Lachnospiraceae bacterium]MBR4210709.1 TIGR03936 family radical SAM-associated protein [Lachnospiraceae bacterium]
MKVRVKFTKSGPVKFIGHLDVMRYFQKANRRAQIPVKYSEGFNPHQIMSFAAPLGLGDTSECEYMDMEVLSSGSSKEMIDRMNAVMVEGIRVISWKELPDKSQNAMAAMAAADYVLSFREGYAPEPWDAFVSGMQAFLSQPEIRIVKKSKKSEKEVDIRPLLYSWSFSDGQFFCQVAAGSLANLKPELLIEAYCQEKGLELSPFAVQVHRKELYADEGTDGVRKLVPLENVGKDIL